MRSALLCFALLYCIIFSLNAQDTLLLFHPTANNIEILQNLDQQDLFDLEGYHVLGIYHSKEAYDFEAARQKILENPEWNFSLREISGDLEPATLFEINSCTPDFKRLFSSSRGALFMGGPDIPPTLYNEKVHLLTLVTDPFRHYLEASFIFHLLGGKQDAHWSALLQENEQYLISGICLGMQTMNVATGGTMIQDIPTEMYGIWTAEELLELPPDQMHRSYLGMVLSNCTNPTSYHFHQIEPMKNSFLRKDLKFRKKTSPLVLSSHHQAIESPGEGWLVAATSPDGKIIEAIEHERYPHVWGVQFHPEKPGLFDPDIIHPVSCFDQINFQQEIIDTDSYTFHKAYWECLGRVLQENRQ